MTADNQAPQQTTADLVAAIEQWVASRNVQASANYIVQDAASLLTRAADALRAKEKRQAEAEEGERRAHMELGAVTMALTPMRNTLLDPPDGGNVRLGEQVARLVAAYRALHAGRVGSGEVEAIQCDATHDSFGRCRLGSAHQAHRGEHGGAWIEEAVEGVVRDSDNLRRNAVPVPRRAENER